MSKQRLDTELIHAGEPRPRNAAILRAVSIPTLWRSSLLIAASSMVSLLAIELSNTWWFTMLQQHVPEHARSRVSSYDWLVSLVFQPLGLMLAGPLAATIGLAATLLGAAAVAVAANLGVLLVRAVRDVRWVEDAREPEAA